MYSGAGIARFMTKTRGATMDKALYKRVIIKLSGEALAGEKGNGIDEKILDSVVDQIIDVKNLGVEIGIIVGGGNFWRGRQGREMDRTTADHMGMLATVINALAIQDALERKGVPTRVQTALTEERRKEIVKQIKKMAEDAKVAVRNVRRDAMDALKKMKNDKELSEDEHAVCEKEIDKVITEAIEKIDKLYADKEKDVLSV